MTDIETKLKEFEQRAAFATSLVADADVRRAEDMLWLVASNDVPALVGMIRKLLPVVDAAQCVAADLVCNASARDRGPYTIIETTRIDGLVKALEKMNGGPAEVEG